MFVQNLVPIGPQATTCIPSEGCTHTYTHTLSYIDIDISVHVKRWFRNIKSSNVGINKLKLILECVVTSSKQIVAIAIWF